MTKKEVKIERTVAMSYNPLLIFGNDTPKELSIKQRKYCIIFGNTNTNIMSLPQYHAWVRERVSPKIEKVICISFLFARL